MLDIGRQAIRRAANPLLRSIRNPFEGPRYPILHFAHHRVGTVWFTGVLRAVAGAFSLRFYQHLPETQIDPGADVFLFPHSQPGFHNADAFRGSHMIRDPRDVVVSGFFYHLWTDEKWVHAPLPEFENKTYQEHLQSLSQDEGIVVEMRRFAEGDLQAMVAWDYSRPDFIELKYEDVIVDENSWFARMFRHYGFREDAVSRAVEIAGRFSFERKAKRPVGQVEEKSHLRAGRPGQWREVFSPDHVSLMKELAGPALIKLGYEVDENW